MIQREEKLVDIIVSQILVVRKNAQMNRQLLQANVCSSIINSPLLMLAM